MEKGNAPPCGADWPCGTSQGSNLITLLPSTRTLKLLLQISCWPSVVLFQLENRQPSTRSDLGRPDKLFASGDFHPE